MGVYPPPVVLSLAFVGKTKMRDEKNSWVLSTEEDGNNS